MSLGSRKAKLLAVIAVVLFLLAVVIIVALDQMPSRRLSLRPLEKATVVTYSNALTEGMDISGCVSEYFYSTQVDKSVQDDFRILKTENDCYKYFQKYWDIQQTYPERWGESLYQRYYENGCVGVVIAPTALQDSTKGIVANGIYTDEAGNAVVELVQMNRDANYGYSADPGTDCAQVYAVVYLPREAVDGMNTLTFAVNDSICVSNDDCVS